MPRKIAPVEKAIFTFLPKKSFLPEILPKIEIFLENRKFYQKLKVKIRNASNNH